MRRVAVLRPEPGATATLERARQRGLDAFALPLFEIEAVPWNVANPDEFDALLLTSANAVRFGGKELAQLLELPVHAVGEATADAAREAGFGVTSIGDRGVDALLGSLDPKLKLLHLCGEHRNAPANARQEIVPLVVYRSIEMSTSDVRSTRNTVALIHSTRAGRRFAELASDRGSVAIAAISPAAAKSVGNGWEIVQAAESPDDDALLALAERLCNKHQRT